MKSAILLLSMLISLSGYCGELEFHWNKDLISKVDIKNVKLNVLKKDVYNPFRKYSKTYEGYDLLSLLDSVYGEKWRMADTIVFTASDGFIQNASIKKMLAKGKAHQGLLAFKEAHTTGFSVFEKNGKKIDPGPFYLVWTNFDGRSVANYNDDLKWPYQLKKIKILKKK